MGTVIFHPCYSLPGFSTSSQCSKQPKLRPSIFFLKGIADGWSREAFPRFPRLKVSSKILDVEGGETVRKNGRVRPPKKKILRNKTPTIKESDINALVKQVQSSLRKETADNVKSQEMAASSSKRISAPGGGSAEGKSPAASKRISAPSGGSAEGKSPAAEFWENYLHLRNQALVEKPPAKEGNGALPKTEKNQTVGDTTTKPAQKKKTRITTDTKAASHIPEIPQPVIVDLKSTRPRSNFKKRSPISPLPLEKLLSSEASLPAVAAKTEKPELSSSKPLQVVAAKTEKPELSSSKPLQVVAARTKEPEEVPALGEMELPELSSEALSQLDVMTKSELRLLAKSRGVRGLSRINKGDLLKILKSLE